MAAAARCADNHDVYRALVALEIESTFPFQQRQWLCDIAPQLLDDQLQQGALNAKARAARRENVEREFPQGLLYERGWPTRMPTAAEAELLASIRVEVASAVGIAIRYSCAESICERYAELLARKKTETRQ